MTPPLRVVSLLFLFLLSLNTFAGDTDTTKVSNANSITKYFNANQFEYADSVNYIDNSLYDFQKYNPKNVLGNTGLAFHDTYYHPFLSELGFNYAKNNYSQYFYTPQNLAFFNTRTPYTDLLYIVGTKKELNFKMTFSYNIKKNWNVTANFYRIRSDGVYERQNTNDNFVAVSTNYKTKNNRYWLLASVMYNGAKAAENGGMKSDSAFEGTQVVDQRLLITNLQLAKRSFVNRNVTLKQIFNLGEKSADTTADKRVIIPGSRFILTSSYDDNYIKYDDSETDLTSGYYRNLFYDSTLTHDSTYYRKIENELEWKRVNNQKYRGLIDLIGIGFSVKHQLVQVKQQNIDILFNNIITGAELYNTYSKNSFWWNVSGNYIVNGYNKEDYEGVIALRKKLADSLIDLTLQGTTRQQTADFIYSEYRSNNFIWNNHFEKMQQTGAEFSFKMKKYYLELTADINTYKNVLYFDTAAAPRQYNGSIPIVSAYLKKDFILYNWHLNNKITYQNLPTASVIRLPEFTLEHSLYYEHDLLHKALRLQIGAGVYYTSAYYADAYMPVTGQFYMQNNKKYGDYPFIDFFINAKVKTVRIFFKIDHLNSGWTGNNYILTPGYPYPGRTFKFGVSWKFYD